MKYIWIGASSLAEKMYHKWVRVFDSYHPSVILDNSSDKCGTDFHGISIKNVSTIHDHILDDDVIIITSSFVDEIREQLSSLGIFNNVLSYNDIDATIDVKLLGKNKTLSNSTSCKRCFILGSGPSLVSQNLDCLVNEDVLSVNHIYRCQQIINLNPKYWVIADPKFWLESETFLNPIIDTLENRLRNTNLFMPTDSLTCIKKEYSNNDRIFFYSTLKENYNDKVESVDFSYPLPPMLQNVICPSIMLSIFLGYEYIYLLGCDHTWWGFSDEDITNYKPIPHIYNSDKNDSEIIKDCYNSLGFTGLKETIERQRFEYNSLRCYAESMNVKIVNLTNGGKLDCFERDVLERIITGEE